MHHLLDEQVMSQTTGIPLVKSGPISYTKRFMLYSKNSLHLLEPILLFIAEQAKIPIKDVPTQKTEAKESTAVNAMVDHQRMKMEDNLSSSSTDDLNRNLKGQFIKLSPMYPIFKLLKAIARMFLLNQIELIFLVKVLQLTQWNFNHDVIIKINHLVYPFIAYDTSLRQETHYDKEMKESLRESNVARETEFKKLCLYIMLAGYCAKYFFTNKGQTGEYLKEANRYIQDFEFVFRKWMCNYKNINQILSPKVLNEAYVKAMEMEEKDQLNYNLAIDLILQLSPAYTTKQALNNCPIKIMSP